MVLGDILYYGKGIELIAADNQKFKIKNKLEAIGFKILGIPHIGLRQRARIAFSLLKLEKKDIVLDAGCGIGLNSFEIYGKVKKITGIDLDQIKIKQAKKLAKRSKKNIKFLSKDLIKLKENEEYDKIMCSDVIEHIPEYKKVISSLAKSLKQNGKLALTFPSYTEFNKKTYKQFGHFIPGFKLNEIKKILKQNNLIIKQIKYYAGTFVKISFGINNILFKNKVLTAIFFYPLYLISFLDIFSKKRNFNGIALLIQKQKN